MVNLIQPFANFSSGRVAWVMELFDMPSLLEPGPTIVILSHGEKLAHNFSLEIETELKVGP